MKYVHILKKGASGHKTVCYKTVIKKPYVTH